MVYSTQNWFKGTGSCSLSVEPPLRWSLSCVKDGMIPTCTSKVRGLVLGGKGGVQAKCPSPHADSFREIVLDEVIHNTLTLPF